MERSIKDKPRQIFLKLTTAEDGSDLSIDLLSLHHCEIDSVTQYTKLCHEEKDTNPTIVKESIVVILNKILRWSRSVTNKELIEMTTPHGHKHNGWIRI